MSDDAGGLTDELVVVLTPAEPEPEPDEPDDGE